MDLILLIVTCGVNLLLGLIVFMRDIRKSYAQLFASVTILLCVWITSNYITNHSTHNLFLANIANNLAYVSGYGVLFVALLFTYVFPVRREVARSEIILVCLIVLMTVLLSMTEFVAGKVSLDENTRTLVFSTGALMWLYISAFCITLGLIIRNLMSIARKQKGIRGQQARLLLGAFGLTAFFGLVFNAIIPLLSGSWDSTRYGPLVSIILVGMIAYTIIRHGLFDIRLAVVRGATYILSLATLAITYYFIAFAISNLFLAEQYSGDQNALDIILALLLAFIFQPVKRFFDRLTNRVFYRDNYDIGDFFARFSKELGSTTDLHEILERAAEEIHETIKAESTLFFVRYTGHYLHVGKGRYNRVSLEEVKDLDEFIERKGSSIILTDMLESTSLRRLLVKHHVALVLPLAKDNQIIGYLFLGHQRSRNYTRRDIRALETISDELVIAIQNALSVQEVKEINDTLQERIEDATKELRKTNEQLQKLDAAKDEFVSMASHQLRTPLTSVKGYISMVLEGDVGKISPLQRQLLSEAFTSSERMVHLIGDFLNVSRLQTGKFILEKKPVNLAKLVSQEIDSLQTTIEAHGLKLNYRKPSYFPVLMLDEGKIRQVLMNFIDNAIFYSQEGMTITVKLSIESGYAVLRVIDTGIGVPKSEQAHLFTKFFRASNARKQRPDGTGVGLFLAKKVIATHGGTMVFESEEGKGSVFGFRLPIKKLQVSEKEMKTLVSNRANKLKK